MISSSLPLVTYNITDATTAPLSSLRCWWSGSSVQLNRSQLARISGDCGRSSPHSGNWTRKQTLKSRSCSTTLQAHESLGRGGVNLSSVYNPLPLRKKTLQSNKHFCVNCPKNVLLAFSLVSVSLCAVLSRLSTQLAINRKCLSLDKCLCWDFYEGLRSFLFIAFLGCVWEIKKIFKSCKQKQHALNGIRRQVAQLVPENDIQQFTNNELLCTGHGQMCTRIQFNENTECRVTGSQLELIRLHLVWHDTDTWARWTRTNQTRSVTTAPRPVQPGPPQCVCADGQKTSLIQAVASPLRAQKAAMAMAWAWLKICSRGMWKLLLMHSKSCSEQHLKPLQVLTSHPLTHFLSRLLSGKFFLKCSRSCVIWLPLILLVPSAEHSMRT